MSSNSKVLSFVTAKCPNCGKGSVFSHNLYSTKFIEVNKECECCKFSYEPEPGFYYGAMYFAYAINVGIIITLLIAFNLIYDKFPPMQYFITLICIIGLGFNIIGRVSRLLMLYLFGQPK